MRTSGKFCGLVLYCACAMERQPACMLFSKPIDSLAAAGSILASVWLEGVSMPVVDSLGEEFLEYVKEGMTITVKDGGVVLYCACPMHRQPACLLFSNPIDSLAAAGSILASVWLDGVNMPVIDSLGQEFLDYMKDDMTVTVKEDGTVVVD